MLCADSRRWKDDEKIKEDLRSRKKKMVATFLHWMQP